MAAISNALMAVLKSGDHVVRSAFALIICGFCYLFFYFLLLWLFLQDPKVHLPGRQCDQKSSAGDQNFTGGYQYVTTNIAMANNDVQIKWLKINHETLAN